MTRSIAPLIAVVALLLAACGADQTADATATPAPTPFATPTEEPTPTDEPSPSATDDGSGTGSSGDLIALLPDEVAGMPIQTIDGLDEFIRPSLEAQGIEADEADFAFASWGEGTDAVIVTAMRMPGLDQSQLQLLASMMSGAQSGTDGVEFETEETTVGGKQVLRMSGEGTPEGAYVYLSGDAFFTVISESPELAEELLSLLP